MGSVLEILILQGSTGLHSIQGKESAQTIIEPLSERELGVLKLLGTDLSGPEIAGQLFVSLNTFHSHTKSIYTKLGVNTRRAEKLGLF